MRLSPPSPLLCSSCSPPLRPSTPPLPLGAQERYSGEQRPDSPRAAIEGGLVLPPTPARGCTMQALVRASDIEGEPAEVPLTPSLPLSLFSLRHPGHLLPPSPPPPLSFPPAGEMSLGAPRQAMAVRASPQAPAAPTATVGGGRRGRRGERCGGGGGGGALCVSVSLGEQTACRALRHYLCDL